MQGRLRSLANENENAEDGFRAGTAALPSENTGHPQLPTGPHLSACTCLVPSPPFHTPPILPSSDSVEQKAELVQSNRPSWCPRTCQVRPETLRGQRWAWWACPCLQGSVSTSPKTISRGSVDVDTGSTEQVYPTHRAQGRVSEGDGTAWQEEVRGRMAGMQAGLSAQHQVQWSGPKATREAHRVRSVACSSLSGPLQGPWTWGRIGVPGFSIGKFAFSFLHCMLLWGAGHNYGVLFPKEQLEPSGVSVGCFVSRGFERGKPCPKCRSPGIASFSEARGFQGESRSIPTTGSCDISDS